MKRGVNDKVLEKMLDINGRAVSKIKSHLKGTQPFASREIPPEDLIYAKNNIGFQDIPDLVNEFGRDAVNKLLYDITVMESKRQKSGTIRG
jgi:hypothetical protein